MTRRGATFVVVIALVPLAGTAGCASRAQSSGPLPRGGARVASLATDDPPTPFAYASTSRVRAGTAMSPQDATDRVLAGLDKSMFASVTVGDTSPDGDTKGPWFYATMLADSDSGPSAVLATWEAEVAEGAIADLINPGAKSLADVIHGATIELQTPDGALHDVGAEIGNIAPNQQFGAEESDAQARSSVIKSLSTLGIDATGVEILNPLDRAIRVVAVAPDIESLKTSVPALSRAVLGDPPAFEGMYIEVRDKTGAPVVVLCSMLRNGSGGFWLRPGLNPSEFGILTGGRYVPTR